MLKYRDMEMFVWVCDKEETMDTKNVSLLLRWFCCYAFFFLTWD